jgi:hypothetical protein
MRTSLREIEHIEKFIGGQLPAGERLVMEARVLTDQRLRLSVKIQTWLYRLLRIRYHRQLKNELATVHERLMNQLESDAWQNELKKYFNK